MGDVASPTAVPNPSQAQAMDIDSSGKKSAKRKRASIDPIAFGEGKESLIAECRRELDELFEYYKVVSGHVLDLGDAASSSLNSAVACLLEESNLPFSKLVDKAYETLKTGEENQGVNLASVRSAVLYVGQRVLYGIANADADVLEDESESCLWCWETRDMKFFAAIQRGKLNVRRVARKKIHERILALSETISALSIQGSDETCKSDILNASDKLAKALNAARIRSLVEKLQQKNDVGMAGKEAKLKEKESVKELEKNKRSVEKEQKRIERDLQKEKLQTEKEMKRLQDEAIKEERRREKEEAELKKQLKKQQEDAEKDQRRREKEEADIKKQNAIQKQATIMERFLKRRKDDKSSDVSGNISSTQDSLLDSSCKVEEAVNTSTSLIDHALSQQECSTAESLLKSHIAGWHKSCHSNRSRRWGIRQNPKIKIIKELKLQGSTETDPLGKLSTPNTGLACEKVNESNSQSPGKFVVGWEATVPDDSSCQCHEYVAPASARLQIKKLLQFDKSHRPAYYGTWSKKSSVVKPQHPFRKDPVLDYDVDSDDEWEEEDPGESLSDCEKDIEDDQVEEGNPKSDDEDDSEDGFVVPDGYLSESEGIQANNTHDMEGESINLAGYETEIKTDEFGALLQHQKYLHSLTEQALRKSQTLVILNLMHEKSTLIMAEGLVGTAKLEQICLHALCMSVCPGGSIIEAFTNDSQPNEIQENCNSLTKNSTSPVVSAAVIADSDLPEFVESIRACPHGINKVVESLQKKFPSISKAQLKNKVREVSNFVENRWQIKKEVLERLGMPASPDQCRRPKGIATFFSKRCLPPVLESMSTSTSPQPCPKPEAFRVEDERN